MAIFFVDEQRRRGLPPVCVPRFLSLSRPYTAPQHAKHNRLTIISPPPPPPPPPLFPPSPLPLFPQPTKPTTITTMKCAIALVLLPVVSAFTFPPITSVVDAFSSLLNSGSSGDVPPCCVACPNEGEVKYYSIDTRHDLCGECCMNPKDYNTYHLFEKGLTLATVQTNQCEVLGYPAYTETVTHGALMIKMTLDLYDHAPEVEGASAVDVDCVKASQCAWNVNDPTAIECCTGGEMCIMGVGCRC